MIRFTLALLCLLASVSAQAAVSLEQLQQLIAQQRYDAAALRGEELLQQNPRHARARFLTAYAHQMSNQPNQAVSHYQALIEQDPTLPEPRNNLAMIYIARGDYDRASELLVEALNTHPSYATAYQNLSEIYKGIASEAYRRAVSESKEPASYTHDIKLSAITRLESVSPVLAAAEVEEEPSAINFANQETMLIERVKLWADAWSGKDFAAYTGFYSPQFSAKFESHQQWLDYRRKRILRPGTILVEVSDIQIKWRSDTRAIIDFRQAFDSPNYSDRVIKRIELDRIGSEWKITEERVLSVL